MKQTAPGHAQHDYHQSDAEEQHHVGAQHIASLAAKIKQTPDQSHPRPKYATGVRRQYLEAVQAEARAKQEYEVLRVSDLRTVVSGRESDQDVLLNHVNALKQRQHHVKLDSLTHYAEEFEKLLPTVPVQHDYEEAGDVDDAANKALDFKRQEAASLNRNLDIAVVEAQAHAHRQRSALQIAQAGIDVTAISPASRLHALHAVRIELTIWIEENLAACGMDDLHLDSATGEKADVDPPSIEDVEKAYEEYVEARKRLVAATEGLSAPQLNLYGEDVEQAERTKITLEADTTTAAEEQLSSWQEARSLAAFKSYVQTETESEEGDTVDILRRLADESQLLPAYPILAKSGRFKKVVSKLDSNEQNEGDQVGSHVQAWTFAAGAAETASDAAVTTEARLGNEAVDKARHALKNMTLLQESAARAHH